MVSKPEQNQAFPVADTLLQNPFILRTLQALKLGQHFLADFFGEFEHCLGKMNPYVGKNLGNCKRCLVLQTLHCTLHCAVYKPSVQVVRQ